MTRFIVVPQWQGSPSSRAMVLIDGAEAIAGDLPRSATTTVTVPPEAGESLGTGIRRFSSLARVRDALTDELARTDGPAVVVGGDCAVAVAAIGHAARRHPRLAVVWLDAHGDLSTPETSPSGALAGMALRAVVEQTAFGPAALAPDRVVLAGARQFDDAEWDLVAAGTIRHVPADAFADPEVLAEAVAATGADAVHIHVDLDVIDPAELTGVAMPVPFGVPALRLVAAIAALRARVPLAGASLTGFAPSSPAAAVEDMGTILRVVGALA